MITNNEETKDIAVKSDWDMFTELQKSIFASNSIPTIPSIKFHGDTGKYSESEFNKEINEWSKKDIGTSFSGIILSVKFMARWKYKENAQFDIRTREFSDFSRETIELLKINNSDRSAQPETKTFDSYNKFKECYGFKMPETDEVRYPHDLFVSLYVLVDNKVKRFRFSGTSRSAWFEYTKLAVTPTLVVTEFGTSAPIEMNAMDENGQQKRYYKATFRCLGEIPATLRNNVISANNDLSAWMNAWKAKRDSEDDSPIIAKQLNEMTPVNAISAPEEAIRTEDIPF